MHAQHKNGDFRKCAKNPPGCDQTIHAGQGAIHNDDLRLQLYSEANRVFAIARLSDHRDVLLVLEDSSESTAHETVIVDQQDRDLSRHDYRFPLLELVKRLMFLLRKAEENPDSRPVARPAPAWRPIRCLLLASQIASSSRYRGPRSPVPPL